MQPRCVSSSFGKFILIPARACIFVSGWIHSSMFTLIRSSHFDEWLSALADQRGKARILARLNSVALGNFGDCEPVGEGVSEMRVHFGPGYRVYFVRKGATVYLLLTGGDKGTQRRDIERAKEIAREFKESER